MISPREALDFIFEHTVRLESENIPVREAAGRILAKDIYASDPLPSFDNAAMDGYAVKTEDLRGASKESPVSLKIRDIIRAGRMSKETLSSKEAMKIMTGAPVPMGADAVIMKERTKEGDNNTVLIYRSPAVCENIRKKGEDVLSGALILKQGIMIRPYEIALAASQGLKEVSVIKKPLVSIITTGDELIDISEPLSLGMIRNSNGPAIAGALHRWGIKYLDMGIVKDNPDRIEDAIKRSLSKSDLVIISGGVSVGDYDYTRSLCEKAGVKEIFWKAAIKPGKPLFYGVYRADNKQTKIIFGLPGNPVSALVCLEEFIRPAIEKLEGYTPKYPSYHMKGKVTNSYKADGERQQYIFCSASSDEDGGFLLNIIRPQGSAMMGMSCQANALAVAPIGTTNINTGDSLSFRWLK